MAEEFEIIRANLLPAAGTITDNDMILIIQGGRPKRALPSAMKGKQGDPGLSAFLGISDKYILWKQGANGTWQNLLEIEKIRGPKGEKPVFRKLNGTLQMKYEGEPDSAYVDIFDREELKMKFSDLTPAEVDRLKLHFSDLTETDKAELMKPATDAAKEVREEMDVITGEANTLKTDLRQLEATVEEQEEIRENSYTQWQAKEQARQNDELKRKETEAARVLAEAERARKEAERNATFDEKVQEAETQANYAQEQGDYAKQQGLRVGQYDSRIMALEENKIDGGYAEENMLYLTVDGIPVGDPIPVGSGTGGGGGAAGIVMKVRSLTDTLLSAIVGATLRIGYNFTSIYQDDESETGDGTATYTINSQKVATQAITQGDNYFDVSKWLVVGTNKVKVTVLDTTGQSRSLAYTVEVISLSLSDSYDDTQVNTGDITYRYTPVGAIAKTVHFILDGTEIATKETTDSNRQLSQVIPSQTHGAHRLEVYMTATVNGVEVRSNTLTHDLICVAEGNNTVIVASSFNQTTAQQYDRLSIPFVVYNPVASTSAVTLSVDGVALSEQTVDRTLQAWTYRIIQPGALALKIASGSVSRTFNLTVTEAAVIVEPETADLALHLTSANRSNNDNNKEEWKFSDITASLTDFNFKTNGWITENGSTALRVSGDARVAIPYHIFATDFRATGKSIEFEFETRDVIDYDAVVIDCLVGGIGLRITAQEALFKSEQTTVSTRFKEEERVRVSFVIEKKTDHRLIYIYINGILSGVAQYPAEDNFQQVVPCDIVIGSNACSVDLFNIRIYDNNLTEYQMLDNYIGDIDDYDRKVEVYERNQVYDEYGNISYQKVLEKIPCMILEGSLPTFKGDKKTNKVYFADLQNPSRDFSCENIQNDVQGTSSQYYPRKNFKYKFKTQITYTGTGDMSDDYALRSNSIPVNCFCLKADFAESSGTHNTGMAKIIENLLKDMGILTPPQQTDPRVRTTVDGYPICVFHRETADSELTFVGKYNFNNDKSTEATFGFSEGDESWEFKNNTSDRSLFKSADFTGTDWLNDFEARYPDDDAINAEYEAGARKPVNLMAIMEWVVSTANDTNKFKAEVAEHFDLRNLLSYYLITELFGMVDQRAKNMFLTRFASDGKWRFIFYDNDTCNGINNEGLVAFGYGVEYHDTIDTLNVFNGEQSVLWNNVEAAFADELAEMYREMRTHLSYVSVLAVLNGEQSDKWCEAIYNADGRFKYVDPLIEDGNGSYLYACQGSRAEHRKWWLYNRFLYMDSKYNAGDFLIDYATMRLYTPQSYAGVEPDANFTIVPFADQYVRVKFGSYIVGKRCQKDVAVVIEAPAIQFNDTETIVYGASRVKSLGDLAGKYAGTIDMSKAVRLSELHIGSDVEGYHNDNLTVLSVGSNKMLRKLDIQNCPNLKQAVELSQCENIEEIYAQGTSITAVVLAAAGNLYKLYLPGTVTNLSLKNQPKLLDAFFEIAGVERLSTIISESTPGVNIFPLVDRCLSAITPALNRVRLIDLNATGANLDTLYKLIRLGGVDEKGNNVATAVVTGKYHAVTAVEDKLAAIRAAFPELTVTYTNLKAPTITTFTFSSSQSKTIANSTFECNFDAVKVNETTYKVTADDDSVIEFTFRCDNHEDYSDTYLVAGTRSQSYKITYIPLRKIRVQVYNQSIYPSGARVIIGDKVYVTDSQGYATLDRGGEAVSGTVEASGYAGSTFSFNAITNDSTFTVYVYAAVEIKFVVKNGANELVQGVTVTCDGKSAVTNMYGECILLLEKGTYEYTLSHPDYLNVTKRISVGTSASIETSYTSSLITFTVKNEFGSPIQGAILQYDEREVVSDENGICEIMSDSGKYEYIIIANQYISNTGESNISLGRNYSYNITLNIDVFKFKPEENRNIQMLVVAPKVTLTIKSTTVDYIVNWGDETSVIASGTGSIPYSHTYADSGVYQIEISNCAEITSAIADSSSLIAYWSIGESKVQNITFRNYSNLKYFGNVFKNDTDRTSVEYLFVKCSNLITPIDLKPLSDLVNVTNASKLFGDSWGSDTNLTNIDLRPLAGWKKVTKVDYMFRSCISKTTMDLTPLSGWVNVTSAIGMFDSIKGLHSIDLSPLSGWVNVTSIESMFSNRDLTNIDLTPLSGWVNVTDISWLFTNSHYLASIDFTPLANWINITKTMNLISSCSRLAYVIFGSSIPFSLESGSLSNGNTCPIYVPDDAVDAYRTATNWSAYASRIKPISDFSTDFPNETLEEETV
ncbi:CotH kinase family protein [uncultured Parabacteroides sp.]|nr:CotH kinase family protein [uncultured Parabacteroides sp.]